MEYLKKYLSFHLENYQEHCRSIFENLLNSRLFTEQLQTLEDYEAFLRRPYEQTVFSFAETCENFYRIVSVGETCMANYYNRDYTIIPLLDEKGNKVFNIKESDFRYDIYILKGMRGKYDERLSDINNIYIYEDKLPKRITTIDDKIQNKFKCNTEYLFDYQIEGIDVYSKRRKAYRFASIPQDEKERLLFYKHHLSVIQIFILRYALHYPRLFTPFWHEYICGSLCDIVEELFNIEYRNMYEIKLQGLMDKVGHIEYLDMDI